MRLTTIWKIPLPTSTRSAEEMIPIGSKLLSIGMDRNGMFAMWLAVDPDERKYPVELHRVGTGGQLPNVGSYLGTISDAGEIWHFFTGPGNSLERAVEMHYLTKE